MLKKNLPMNRTVIVAYMLISSSSVHIAGAGADVTVTLPIESATVTGAAVIITSSPNSFGNLRRGTIIENKAKQRINT